MGFTRRDFLKLLASAALIAAGTGGSAAFLRKTLQNGESTPTSNNELNNSPNELSKEQLAVLVYLVPAIFIMSPPSTTEHYEHMFRVRSKEQKKFRIRYRRAANKLQLRANEELQKPYGELQITERRLLVQKEIDNLIFEAADIESSAIVSIQETIIDIMRFYMCTDAYLALGYEAWPGTPRGLITYRKAPGKS